MTEGMAIRKNDKQSDREFLEIKYSGMVYRCVSLLKNRYRITGILSVGGFGVIYTGEDTRLYYKKVLIKTCRYPKKLFHVQNDRSAGPEINKIRFRLEFERKMLLQAANREVSGIPVLLEEIRDIGFDLHGPHMDRQNREFYFTQKTEQGLEYWKNEPFLVLSYVSGQPLNQVIPQQWFTRYAAGNAKQVILQIGRILKRFHDRETVEGSKLSFIYQDLKPDNIIFTSEKTFALIDFGGFAVRADNRTLTRFAKTGTPGYQPPEFSDYSFPPEKIDHRADIFSLGATVYHVLTGNPPAADHQGRAVFDMKQLQLLPEPWKKWIEKTVCPKPDDRFQNMAEVLKAAYGLPLKSA